ncbi:MipA/OmpV family protein [Enterobacteriaceae bacterium H11S18]|uniref:MipA/OmpV family protein n=1 Tax=Dryocola clanedunensis TaxID=2925396 RepID=UPI0022F06926|nr:MipA/OmpV family protein [Dryocola clanedunensis]MCT4712980.1 MipA/OmpV family protein [Dryocola clanedunensis]
MSKFKILALGAFIASSFPAAHAEGPWSLGAAVLVTPNPYKGDQDRVYPVPMIGYEGEDFYLRGFNAGYYLWNDKTDKLSAVIYYDPLHFRPKDSNYRNLRALDSRKATMMAGLSYVHNTEYGFLRTVLAGDVLDNSNGINWDTAWLYRYNADRLTLTPGIGVQWSSENQNEYYYGVSKKESSRSGVSSYDPSNGWSPYVELSVNYKLTDDWNVFGMGRYIRLSDEVNDSPIIDRQWTGVLLTGITYSF